MAMLAIKLCSFLPQRLRLVLSSFKCLFYFFMPFAVCLSPAGSCFWDEYANIFRWKKNKGEGWPFCGQDVMPQDAHHFRLKCSTICRKKVFHDTPGAEKAAAHRVMITEWKESLQWKPVAAPGEAAFNNTQDLLHWPFKMQCIIKRKINRIAKYFNLNRRLSAHDLRLGRFYDPLGIEVLTKRAPSGQLFGQARRYCFWAGVVFAPVMVVGGRIKWTLWIFYDAH